MTDLTPLGVHPNELHLCFYCRSVFFRALSGQTAHSTQLTLIDSIDAGSAPSFPGEVLGLARKKKAPLSQSKLFQHDRTLIYGDNLKVLRNDHLFREETIDLIYLDPPFKPLEKYNVLHRSKSGKPSFAQVRAFDDAWNWESAAKAAYHDTMENCPASVRHTVDALEKLLGKSDMFAYVCMMAPRLVEMHKMLRPTGSLYLHCDQAANHYLRILLDSVFGPENLRNEIIWHYFNKLQGNINRFPSNHDVIYWYSKSDSFVFNVQKEQREKPVKQLKRVWDKKKKKIVNAKDPKTGKVMYITSSEKRVDDVWRMPMMQPASGEWLGYPTQKPRPLLSRIIAAGSNPGDLVLDPFCGCGTTIEAAEEQGRRWVGIDVAYDAISTIRERLEDRLSLTPKDYEVWGDPETLDDAMSLADEHKYQFQWWAVRRLGAREIDYKIGADAGIDGRLVLRADRGGKLIPEAVISVKAGGTSVAHVRDLRGVIERENAEIGVLVTRRKPTPKMIKEAAEAGEYTDGKKWYPRIQLLTAEDIINGKGVDYPATMLKEKKPVKKPAAVKATRKSSVQRRKT